jgi:hypothetical protein
MNETEPCQVWSIDPPMKIGDGHIGIGCMGLPVLLYGRSSNSVEQYHPWSLPANWTLRTQQTYPGPLLNAWRQIEQVRADLAVWSRRHDDCGRETQHEDRRL